MIADLQDHVKHIENENESMKENLRLKSPYEDDTLDEENSVGEGDEDSEFTAKIARVTAAIMRGKRAM